MIPTRSEIKSKIDQIKKDKTWSTIWEDLEKRIEDWLEMINCPTEQIIASQTINPRQQILDDLRSYE